MQDVARKGTQVHLAPWSERDLVGFRLTTTVAVEMAAELTAPLSRRVRGETGIETAIAARMARAHGGGISLRRDGSQVHVSVMVGRAPARGGGVTPIVTSSL